MPTGFNKLKNLVTGEVIVGQPPVSDLESRRRGDEESRVSFTVHLLPHSYAVFAAE